MSFSRSMAIVLFLLVGSVLAMGLPAQAKLILGYSFAGDSIITKENDFLQLGKKAGGVPVYDVGFTVPADGTYLVTLSVVCGIEPYSLNTSKAGYLDVDLRVDGNSVNSGPGLPLCYGDDDLFPLVGATRKNVTLPVTMKKGRHEFSVATRLGTHAKSAVLRHPAISIDD